MSKITLTAVAPTPKAPSWSIWCDDETTGVSAEQAHAHRIESAKQCDELLDRLHDELTAAGHEVEVEAEAIENWEEPTITVCTNPEVCEDHVDSLLRQELGDDASGVIDQLSAEDMRGLAEEYCGRIAGDLRDSTSFYDVESDGHFHNWRGGKFADQAKAYGRARIGSCFCVTAKWEAEARGVIELVERKIAAALAKSSVSLAEDNAAFRAEQDKLEAEQD